MLLAEGRGSGVIWDRKWPVFTQKELDQASFLAVHSCWTAGYPEPSHCPEFPGTRIMPFQELTYDLSGYCLECCAGERQRSPFRMKNEPRWGRRSFLQLNWVPNDLFVKTSAWEAVFRPLGVSTMSVLLHKSGDELTTAVQLAIPRQAALRLEGAPYEACSTCGRTKYAPITHGFFPAPREPGGPIFKASETFGSGTLALAAILVAAPLYRTIRDAGLKGLEFQPCAG